MGVSTAIMDDFMQNNAPEETVAETVKKERKK